MIKQILYIILFLINFCLFGQESKKTEKEILWKSEKEYYNYQKDKKYKGPKSWYNDNPSSINEEVEEENSQNYNGIQYNPQKIKKNRKKKINKKKRGGGNGSENYDPEIEEPDPIEFPDNNSPDVDDSNNSLTIPEYLWKVFYFIIIFALIIFIAYQLIKHKKPSNKKVILHSLENEWNPEIISKTELELLLEKSIEMEDYRECVRIYFTFILKEIIKKGWIKWKKDKTNYNYILEMKNKPDSSQFEECVRIYDLVWYGEYLIDSAHFDRIQPTLLNYYQKLQANNE